MKNKIKYFMLFPIDFLIIFISIIIFKITGKNNNYIMSSFVRLFCLTGGISNDIVSFLTKKKIIKEKKICTTNNINFSSINNELEKEGYYLLENFLSTDECDELRSFVLQTKLIPKSDLDPTNKEEFFFDENNLKGTIYNMDKNKILNNRISQKILFNKTIFFIAQNYFKSAPLFDHLSLTISAKSKNPDSSSAQLFHFDLDKPKWLKFFIFLNDVDENNGPHFYVPKSHKNSGIVKEIRYRGYERIEDNIVHKNYNDIKLMTAKKGTLLIEDTRGLHKGSAVKKNYRCIAMIQYNNSNFVTDVTKYNLNIYENNDNEFYNSNITSYSNLHIIK